MRHQAGPRPHGLLSAARALFVTLLQLRQPEVTRRLPEWSREPPAGPARTQTAPLGRRPQILLRKATCRRAVATGARVASRNRLFFDAYRVARGRDIGRGAYFGYVRLSPSPLDDWPPRDDVGPGSRNLAVIAGPSVTALLGVLSAVMDLHHQKCPAQKAGHETGCAPLQPQVDTAAEHDGLAPSGGGGRGR